MVVLEIDCLDLCLVYLSEFCSVEWVVCEYLEEFDCVVYYVENGLINLLFGLFCWEVIFVVIFGVFFYFFYSVLVDLYSVDFC